MSLENYYFNLTQKKWVSSFDQPTAIADAFPVFGNTDSRDFSVTFLQNIGASQVEVVQAVVSAQIAISTPATPGTVITSATAGTAANNAFPFVLPISGAGVVAFMSGATTKQVALCEFRLASSLGTNRYQTKIFIAPNQTTDITADPAATDRALGFNEAGGIFLPKFVPQGTRILWPDEVTGVMYSIGLKNGKLEADQL